MRKYIEKHERFKNLYFANKVRLTLISYFKDVFFAIFAIILISNAITVIRAFESQTVESLVVLLLPLLYIVLSYLVVTLLINVLIRLNEMALNK